MYWSHFKVHFLFWEEQSPFCHENRKKSAKLKLDCLCCWRKCCGWVKTHIKRETAESLPNISLFTICFTSIWQTSWWVSRLVRRFVREIEYWTCCPWRTGHFSWLPVITLARIASHVDACYDSWGGESEIFRGVSLLMHVICQDVLRSLSSPQLVIYTPEIKPLYFCSASALVNSHPQKTITNNI